MATKIPNLDEQTARQRERIVAEIRALMGQGIAGKRITQARLASVLGLSHAAVSDRFTGKVAFNTDELDAIARYFGVSIVDLIAKREIEDRVQSRLARQLTDAYKSLGTDRYAPDPADLHRRAN